MISLLGDAVSRLPQQLSSEIMVNPNAAAQIDTVRAVSIAAISESARRNVHSLTSAR
jgi:hypothetical protein